MNEKALFDEFLNKNKQYNFFYEKIKNYKIRLFSTNIIKTIDRVIAVDELRTLHYKKYYEDKTTIQMIIDWKNFKLYNDKKYKRFLRFIKEKNAYNDLIHYSNKNIMMYLEYTNSYNFIMTMIENVINHFFYVNNQTKKNYWTNLKNEWSVISRKLKYNYKTQLF